MSRLASLASTRTLFFFFLSDHSREYSGWWARLAEYRLKGSARRVPSSYNASTYVSLTLSLTPGITGKPFSDCALIGKQRRSVRDRNGPFIPLLLQQGSPHFEGIPFILLEAGDQQASDLTEASD